ncbi:hypothetical protein BKA83DRAFT_4168357 [Pisolithus microcarpus]|nr:hypothetical protein BKA83DRAFT_4168357 [Pisolithus microcarpus]
MLAAATSFFSRTAISQSYNIGGGNASRSSTPTPSGSSSSMSHTSTARIGLWKVQGATHKVTSKRVSVWSFDKRVEMEGLGTLSREHVLEVLKAEATALSRLRHPSILEMVEPLEETRSELIFATEPVLSSLELIQKGILQLCRGLSFLHSSARLIHYKPETMSASSSTDVGDWKISGLGLTISLTNADGTPTRWEPPTSDRRVPSYVQRSFDYIAPEYALDETLGKPPFLNYGSLGSLRNNAGQPLSDIGQLDTDLQGLVSTWSLLTRSPASRPTPSTLPSHPFFSRVKRKISFMKGLTGVLNKFSEGLRVRKILPSLLEEMKDMHLLPYILPNVFAISSILSAVQFAQLVLPSLKPLFTVKDPPQNMLTLLDNLEILQSKTEKVVFREQVLPLVYNALESEHAIVQERALGVVPNLCETIDYAEVSGVLFPRVAVSLAVLPMRHIEPSMATLSVQEAMGFKIEREAVATLCSTIEQFQRFMTVIRKLGDRVEKEHNQFLRDSQRIEDRSALANGSLIGRANATTGAEVLDDRRTSWDDDVWGPILNGGHEVSTSRISISAATPILQTSNSQPLAPAVPAHPRVQSLPSSPRLSATAPLPRPSRLGAKGVPFSSVEKSTLSTSTPLGAISPISPPLRVSSPPQHRTSLPNPSLTVPKPNYNVSLSDVISPALNTPSTPPPIQSGT